MVISAVFCSVFSCILTPLYSECIFVCISMSSECILLYSSERHFLVPATHPPTRFFSEYVFRSRILMYSQSLLRIRILRVFRVYSGVFSLVLQEYGQNTEGHICLNSTLSKYGRIQRISETFVPLQFARASRSATARHLPKEILASSPTTDRLSG